MRFYACMAAVTWAAVAMAQSNLLPNGSFEFVEPPAPTAERAKTGGPPSAEEWLHRTWSVWSGGGATWQCPDDPAQAHTGRRSVRLGAKQGQAWLRYAVMPAPAGRAWTIRFWVKGQGSIAVCTLNATTDHWQDTLVETREVPSEWEEVVVTWTAPEGWRKWGLTLTTQGATECWIDDVVLSHAGVQTPPWPPVKPLERDEHTLLLLDFEQQLDEDAFYVGGKVGLEQGMEGFGRALALGPEAYVACSADEHLNSLRGTIEVWCKLLAPGGNGVAQPFVSIPGMEGMWLGKDQYSHVGFSFSTGWATLSNATHLGYAGYWQPCWRHVAACWDEADMQVFVDGKLIAWTTRPKLSRFLGPELRIGSPGMMLDDLRLSDVVRYRVEAGE